MAVIKLVIFNNWKTTILSRINGRKTTKFQIHNTPKIKLRIIVVKPIHNSTGQLFVSCIHQKLKYPFDAHLSTFIAARAVTFVPE